MYVHITTVSGVIRYELLAEKETTELSVPEPPIYIHLAVLQNTVGTP